MKSCVKVRKFKHPLISHLMLFHNILSPIVFTLLFVPLYYEKCVRQEVLLILPSKVPEFRSDGSKIKNRDWNERICFEWNSKLIFQEGIHHCLLFSSSKFWLLHPSEKTETSFMMLIFASWIWMWIIMTLIPAQSFLGFGRNLSWILSVRLSSQVDDQMMNTKKTISMNN